MSTVISLTVLDQYGHEIPIHASVEQPIEFFIPRDSNLVLPSMALQHVTSKNNDQPFYLNKIDLSQFVINSNLTVSVHFELRPLDTSLGYVFIYKFDDTPQLNSLINDTDGWALFCPSKN
jgi:hypothetical protein